MTNWSRNSEGISVGEFWRRVRSLPRDKPHSPARFSSMGLQPSKQKFKKKTRVEWSICARSIPPNTSYVHAFRPFWIRCDSSMNNFRSLLKRAYGISRPSVFISVKGNGRTSHFPSWYRLSSPQIWSSYGASWNRARSAVKFCVKDGTLGVRESWGISCIL